MRLIDADSLVKVMKSYVGKWESNPNAGDFTYHSAKVFRTVIDYVNDMPPADAVPVEHAQWKGWNTSSFHGCDDLGEPIYRDAKFYRCSKCNYGTVVKTNYCPNCGAKMKGGI